MTRICFDIQMKVTDYPSTLGKKSYKPFHVLMYWFLQNGSKYSLCAVIVHIGSAMFGHYTAYVHHKGDQSWYYADDSSVRKVNSDDKT